MEKLMTAIMIVAGVACYHSLTANEFLRSRTSATLEQTLTNLAFEAPIYPSVTSQTNSTCYIRYNSSVRCGDSNTESVVR